MARLGLLIALVGIAAEASADEVALRAPEPPFRVELPDVVLTDTPVDAIRITARDRDGHLDRSYNGRPLIEGIRLTVQGRDTALGAFQNGVLELKTDLAAQRRVYITADEIVIDPNGNRPVAVPVVRLWRWWSLVPPLVAILLAVWFRNVLVALFAGIWSGAIILAHGNLFVGLMRTLDTYLVEEFVQPGQDSKDHMLIILFTLFLGAMIGVMSDAGATSALVSRLARWTKRREHGQVLTWALGLLVFFDDYANSLLVGGTMRPVTDRLRISREKLAFLVDSTAAPIAGLALISTWVGFEVGQIEQAYQQLGITGNAYTTFLATIAYRFYPLHLLVFVWLIAYSGHDFGPMLRAEVRALTREPHDSATNEAGQVGTPGRRPLARNVVIPLVTLVALFMIGLWSTGQAGLSAANAARRAAGEPELPVAVWNVVAHADANRVLFLSSFLASLAAIACAVVTRALTLNESLEGWMNGAKSMFTALAILVMAWAIATLCDANHLNTAGVLIELTRGHISVAWMPTLAFLLAAVVSFATGSSFSTMGLLMPLFISMTWQLLSGLNEADPAHPEHHLLLATIGAILAGSIFGDHCSPISDTTVLSSAASGCDHLAHVTTQMPYALCVAGVCVVLGYLPVGLFGYSPVVLLPLGVVVLFLLTQFLGRSVIQAAEEVADIDVAEQPDDAPTADDAEAGQPQPAPVADAETG